MKKIKRTNYADNRNINMTDEDKERKLDNMKNMRSYYYKRKIC